MERYSAEKIAEIRDRVDIVTVVGRSVRLARKGSRMVGLCPFHPEKTPSFGVDGQKGLYHCFGCQVGGDVIDFVMRLEGIDFPEAVRRLAEEGNVKLPEREETEFEKKQRLEREQIYDINELAAKVYEHYLSKNERALTYLKEERGLSPQTIRDFRIGWAGPDWTTLADIFHKKQVDQDLAIKAGLLAKKESRVYDRLRARIVFPIRIPGDKVVGFGGRRADWATDKEDSPKYLNSPESPVYDKSSLLYGLYETRDEIRKERRGLLVEGYLDVISLAQAGIPLALAACGTALTKRHARAISRLAHEVVTLYDGDVAGQEATRKAAQVLLEGGASVRVINLPEGEDPDTYVRENGGNSLKKLIDEAPSAIDFFVTAARAAHGGIAGTAKAVESVKPMILAIADPLERDVTIQAAARKLQVDVSVMRRHLGASPRKAPDKKPAQKRPSQTRMPAPTVVETALLKMLLEAPEEVIGELTNQDAWGAFETEAVASVINAGREAFLKKEKFGAPRALEILQEGGITDEETLSTLRKTLVDELPVRDDVSKCVGRLLIRHKKKERDALQKRILQETDPDVVSQLAEEGKNLNSAIQQLQQVSKQ